MGIRSPGSLMQRKDGMFVIPAKVRAILLSIKKSFEVRLHENVIRRRPNAVDYSMYLPYGNSREHRQTTCSSLLACDTVVKSTNCMEDFYLLMR